jgi:hypothetical protein
MSRRRATAFAAFRILMTLASAAAAAAAARSLARIPWEGAVRRRRPEAPASRAKPLPPQLLLLPPPQQQQLLLR